MDAAEWARLTPEQQAWHWQQHMALVRRQPPPIATEPTGRPVWCWISLGTGLACLIPYVALALGPVAVVCGFVGEHIARRGDRPGARMCMAGIVLGLLTLLVTLNRIGLLAG